MFKLVDTRSFEKLVDTIAMCNTGRNVRVYIDKARLTDARPTTFLKWINQYNPYMIRVRNEVLEQPIELPPVLQFKGESTYTVETDVTPSGIQVKYY